MVISVSCVFIEYLQRSEAKNSVYFVCDCLNVLSIFLLTSLNRAQLVSVTSEVQEAQ